jgi:hypothetical protein
MKDISKLLKKAQSVVPMVNPRSKWVHLLPVTEELVGKGYSTWDAVKWLVSQNEVPAERQRSAYHSILQARKREAK